MKIEIWSDVVCPFCYIGKRLLEDALKQYPEQQFEIEWKSYLLNPEAMPQANENVYENLAFQKGISVEESKAMHQNVANRAKEVGLEYDFDNAKPINSLILHQILHLAKEKNKANEAKELFFKSYFIDGKNLNNPSDLLHLGEQLGIEKQEIQNVIDNPKAYLDDVQKDLNEAQEIGIQGVPFFVFDRKYAVSGAQPLEVFTKTIDAVLEKTN